MNRLIIYVQLYTHTSTVRLLHTYVQVGSINSLMTRIRLNNGECRIKYVSSWIGRFNGSSLGTISLVQPNFVVVYPRTLSRNGSTFEAISTSDGRLAVSKLFVLSNLLIHVKFMYYELVLLLQIRSLLSRNHVHLLLALNYYTNVASSTTPSYLSIRHPHDVCDPCVVGKQSTDAIYTHAIAFRDKSSSTILSKLPEWKAAAENQMNTRVKSIRFDNGKLFGPTVTAVFLRDCGINTERHSGTDEWQRTLLSILFHQ